MRGHRQRILVSVATAATLLLTACGGGGDTDDGSAPAGEPVRGGAFELTTGIDFQTLDPARCGVNPNWGGCQAVFGTLMDYDPEAQELVPGMAEDFTSEDGREWTLRLREGVTFSDGTPFDSAAVIANWDRARDPRILSSALPILETMTYEAVDPRTVRVTLDETNWAMAWALNIQLAFIGSPTALAQRGQDFGNAPVGAGPFTLTEWSRGTRMQLDRNPTYWDQPRPYLDSLAFVPNPSEEQRLNALRADEVTMMLTLTKEIADRGVRDGFVDHPLEQLGGVGMLLSARNEPTADPDVRRAIALLVDTRQISEAVLGGDTPATTFAREGTALYDAEASYPGPDVAAAQALVDGYRQRSGVGEVVLSYKMIPGVPREERLAQLLQSQMQRAQGMRVDIEPVEISAFVDDIRQGNYDLIQASVNGVNPDEMYSLFHTDGSTNGMGYSNPQTDAALERARTTQDPQQRLEAYREATRHVSADIVQLPFRYNTSHLLSRDTVHDVQPSFSYFFRSERVWMEQ